MEFMLKAEKKLKSFSLFGNKKEDALELYQKGAVSRRQRCCSCSWCSHVLLTKPSRLQICFKQAKKWQEAGDAYVKDPAAMAFCNMIEQLREVRRNDAGDEAKP
jgi:hypothetical protein